MTDPAPLPDIQHDPAVQRGTTAQTTYNQALYLARNTPGLSDLERAERVDAAHIAFTQEVTGAWSDLQERRAARLTHLQAQIPTGPDITDDTSAADRAVLSTAFRAELEAARKMPPDAQRAALAEALRFGDDNRIRALLTAADETGHTKVIDDWAAATGHTDTLAEIRHLHGLLQGVNAAARGWERPAFQMPDRPPVELSNIPALRRDDAERQARERRDRAVSLPVWMR